MNLPLWSGRSPLSCATHVLVTQSGDDLLLLLPRTYRDPRLAPADTQCVFNKWTKDSRPITFIDFPGCGDTGLNRKSGPRELADAPARLTGQELASPGPCQATFSDAVMRWHPALVAGSGHSGWAMSRGRRRNCVHEFRGSASPKLFLQPGAQVWGCLGFLIRK